MSSRSDSSMDLVWQLWVEKKPNALAVRSRGQAIAVGSTRAVINIVSGARQTQPGYPHARACGMDKVFQQDRRPCGGERPRMGWDL